MAKWAYTARRKALWRPMLIQKPDNPAAIRNASRQGRFSGPTGGLALGRAQANLAILPREAALEFLIFCQRNPKPCPIIDVTDPGDPEPKQTAKGADIRTDLPLYRVYKQGQLVDEPTDILSYWRDDLVAFLIGCSFTFENAMLSAGLPLKHHGQGGNVPMYITNIQCTPSGRFSGPMVVSMRPMPLKKAIKAVEVTGRYPRAHGAPIHWGDPTAIGIENLAQPDFGTPISFTHQEVPMFWACGVTPQTVMMESKPAFAITHSPGHMFVTDLRDEDLMS